MIKTELISYAISNLNVHKSNPKYKTFCVKRKMNVQIQCKSEPKHNVKLKYVQKKKGQNVKLHANIQT